MADIKISSQPGGWATPVVPVMPIGGGHANAMSNAVGVFYTNFANASCRQVTVANNSNTTVEIDQDGLDKAFPVFLQNYYTFYGLQNTSQLRFRRVDQSNSQVVVNYRYEG